MLPEISTLARLEQLDAQTHDLQLRLTELPKLITAERKSVEEKMKGVEALRAKHAADEKEFRLLEGEMQMHRAKIAKLRKQITQAANDEQYKAFQHEIDFAEAEIARKEERSLALLLELDQLEPREKAEEAAMAQARKEGLEHFKAAEQEHKAGVAQIAANAAQSKELVAGLPAPFATLYERLRRKYKTGPILCEAQEDGSCSVCQMNLRLAFWQSVKSEPDKLWQCEECSRVIVYNPSKMLA